MTLATVWGYAFTLHAVASLATGIFALSLGLSVASRERMAAGSLPVLRLTLAAAIWFIANAFMYAAPDAAAAENWWKASFVGIPVLPASFYGLAIGFLGISGKKRVLHGLMWASGLAITVATIGTGWPNLGMVRHDWGFYPTYGWGGALLILGLSVSLGLAYYELWRVRSRAKPGVDQERLTLLIVTFSLSFVSVVTDFAPTFGSNTPPVAYLIAIVQTSLLFWIAGRYRIVQFTPALAMESTWETLADGVIVCDLDGAIRVTNGSGMDQDVAARAFEPFFTTRPEGTGMGLATVYGIATRAGGDVEIESAVGSGTTVVVRLPWTDDASASYDPVVPPPPAVVRGVGTVLLADDNQAVRQVIKSTLVRAGYSVLEAASGTEALRIWQSSVSRVDILVTDLIMPEMSGRELYDELANRAGELPTLFISGRSPSSEDLEGLPANVRFLMKPFAGTQLNSNVADLIGAHSADPASR